MNILRNTIVANVLLAIIYFIAGQFTLTLALPPSGATPLWAPAGIALAAVLIWGYRLLPGVFLGDLLVAIDLIGLNDLTSVAVCLLIGTQAMFYAWLARYLLEKFKVWPSVLTAELSIVKFFILAGIVSSFFPAALTVAVDLMLGVLDSTTWLSSLIIWWIGGALGVVIFTPIGLILFANPRPIWRSRLYSVAVPMLLMFIVLVITLHSVRDKERLQITERFRNYSDIAHTTVVGELDNYELLLRNLSAFHQYSGDVNNDEFKQFVTASLENKADIYATFWADRVLDKDRVAYEQQLGRPIMVLDNKIQQFVIAGQQSEYLVIKQSQIPAQHIPLLEHTNGFIGVDFCSSNNRKKCDALFVTAQPQLFKPYLIDIDATAEERIIKVLPLIDNGVVVGGVGHVYQYKALFERLLSSDIRKWLDITVIDIAEDKVLFDTRKKQAVTDILNVDLVFKHEFEFGSDQWQFIYRPSADFVQASSSWGFFWMITVSLMLLSLIGAWLMAMSGRVEQIRLQVDEQTGEIVKATQLLKKSESKYRGLVENIQDEYLLFSHGLDGIFDYISPSVTTILGYSQADFLKHYATYMPDSSINRSVEGFTEKTLAGETSNYEVEIVDSTGSIRTLNINETPMFNEAGDIIGVEGIAHDITKRKKYQLELEKLSLAVKHNPNAISITDAEGIFEYINPKFTEITGYRSEEVLGLKPTMLKSGLMPEALYESLWKDIQSGKEWRGEMHNRKKGGELYWSREHICPLFDDHHQVTHFIATQEDVTQAKKLNEEKSYQASHDLLTGLINRREFEARLERVIESAKVELNEHALCFMDLDQFKIVNDTCGHVAGDELLRQIGDLLLANVRQRDTLARLGGDEFALLMEHCSIEQAYDTCQKIIELLADFRFHWEEHTFTIGVSIGMTVIDLHIRDRTEALSRVDGACYAAKDAGRNRVEVYTEDSQRLQQRKGEIQWSAEINKALDEDRFELYCQPIVPLQNVDSGMSYEVLLRLRMASNMVVPPGAFLPAAERYNSATRIDRWVIENTLKWITHHAAQLNHINTISINLSGQSLGDEAMLGFIIREFQRGTVPVEKIKFEITETAAIANLRDATFFMKTLSEFGCRFALDDFGSGLSSFAYLKNLKVDALKIDGMFVKDMLDDPIDYEMVKSINDIGHVMGLETIAEFVENEQVAEELRAIGVDYAQGYALGRPMPIDRILQD